MMARPSAARWSAGRLEWAAGLLVAVVIVATTVTTLRFLDIARKASDVARATAQAQADLNRLSQLAWEAAAEPGLLREVQVNSAVAEGSLDDHLSVLYGSDGLTVGQKGAIRTSVAEYSDALRLMLAILGRGDTQVARAMDEEQVDPLFDEASAALGSHGESMTAASDSAMDAVRTEAVLLIPFGLLVTALLGFRLTRQATTERSRTRFEDLVSGASDMILESDQRGTVSYASPSAVAAFDGGPGSLVGVSILDWVHPQDAAAVLAILDGPLAVSGGEAVIEVRMGSAGGGWRVVESRVRHVAPGSARSRLVWNSRDVTERRKLEGELARQAVRDPLTGLANRAALADEITRSLSAGRRSGKSTAVLMVDLDRFKGVNDSFGHGVGDALLQAAGDRLASTVRGGDFVARHGGDEFVVVVLRESDDNLGAVRAAHRIVDAFRAPFTIRGLELFVTASVGVTVATETSSADDLVREADSAMYAAKNAGRDRVSVFNEELQASAVARLSMEAELRHALDKGELAVWYQPEIDLVTGTVITLEALVRWLHPDGSTWNAGRFVEVAEDIGMISDIDDWVLRTACTQGAIWTRQHPDRRLVVRVNLSARHLSADDLLETLDEALATSGLDPALLCLEITETALLHDISTVKSNLAGVRARRVRLALDDFGTGYASMAYLSRYHVDVLKIDRSFIVNIATSDRDRRLVAGMIALADQFDLTVTAEGVEDQDQAKCLRDLGCPGAQGFLYSKAVPPDQIATLIETGFPRM